MMVAASVGYPNLREIGALAFFYRRLPVMPTSQSGAKLSRCTPGRYRFTAAKTSSCRDSFGSSIFVQKSGYSSSKSLGGVSHSTSGPKRISLARFMVTAARVGYISVTN